MKHFKLVTNKRRNRHQREVYRLASQLACNRDDKETIINVCYK